MKILLSLFIACLGVLPAYSQGIEATYDVGFSIFKDRTQEEHLTMTWKVFHKGNKVASYFIPDYLQKYPDGNVKKQIAGDGNSWATTRLPSAEKLHYDVADFDSFFSWKIISANSTDEDNPCSGQVHRISIKSEWAKYWEFVDETRNINGLECQRVKNRLANGDIRIDAWVATDIPVAGLTFGMYHLPFLLVEATHHSTGRTFKLKSLNTQAEIDDSVFWPECFQQRFRSQ